MTEERLIRKIINSASQGRHKDETHYRKNLIKNIVDPVINVDTITNFVFECYIDRKSLDCELMINGLVAIFNHSTKEESQLYLSEFIYKYLISKDHKQLEKLYFDLM